MNGYMFFKKNHKKTKEIFLFILMSLFLMGKSISAWCQGGEDAEIPLVQEDLDKMSRDLLLPLYISQEEMAGIAEFLAKEASLLFDGLDRNPRNALYFCKGLLGLSPDNVIQRFSVYIFFKTFPKLENVSQENIVRWLWLPVVADVLDFLAMKTETKAQVLQQDIVQIARESLENALKQYRMICVEPRGKIPYTKYNGFYVSDDSPLEKNGLETDLDTFLRPPQMIFVTLLRLIFQEKLRDRIKKELTLGEVPKGVYFDLLKAEYLYKRLKAGAVVEVYESFSDARDKQGILSGIDITPELRFIVRAKNYQYGDSGREDPDLEKVLIIALGEALGSPYAPRDEAALKLLALALKGQRGSKSYQDWIEALDAKITKGEVIGVSPSTREKIEKDLREFRKGK